MGKMSLLDRVELYSSVLREISLDPYAELSHLGNLLALANEADYLIAKRTFSLVDSCLTSIEEKDFDYFNAVGSLFLVGIVPDSVVLCFRLVELLRDKVPENYSLKRYIDNASCELTSCLIGSYSFPVELLIKNNFNEKFKNDRFLERLNASIKTAVTIKRRSAVITYLRQSLKEQVDTSVLSDEMLLSVAGVGS
jgi:hypothetical protein